MAKLSLFRFNTNKEIGKYAEKLLSLDGGQ